MDHQPPLLVIKLSKPYNGHDYSLQPERYNPCSCNNSLYSNNLSILPDNVNGNYKEVSAPSPHKQRHIIEQASPIPASKEQQQSLDHKQIHHVPNFNTMKYPKNCTELLRIETSDVEIIVRKNLLPNLNHHDTEMHNLQQPQEHSPILLGNRAAGRIQNRMHPYQMPPGQNFKYNNKVGNRNSNSVMSVNVSCQCYPKITLTLSFC